MNPVRPVCRPTGLMTKLKLLLIKGRSNRMNKKVRIYSTPTCPYCIRVKEFLKGNNIDFEDIDISTNPAETQEMIRISGQMGVPVLDIEGEIIVGFDKDRIKQALGLT
jgi:glutaredoxin-like YruB-family protein